MLPLRVIRLAKTTAMVCLLSCPQLSTGQTPAQPQRQDQSDVLRVYTELVQTDVMVFDKQGKFVPGLKREDFELRIDGKPKPLEFFEKITAGSVSEESQLAAARGSSARSTAAGTVGTAPLDRGRPVFFYIDDFHLDLPGLRTAQQVMTQFIDKEMGQNDEAAITSASGSIGFLQQLTHEKAVLHAALNRLSIRPYAVRDNDTPMMTEYQAVLIENYDRDITDYFVQETIKQSPGISADIAEHMVKSRARALVQQASYVTQNSLGGLEALVRSARELPGRKLVFFISGGFFLGERGSDVADRLRRITSAAARSSVVIYSMDARGLVASLRDASTGGGFDPTGRLQRAESGELSASQDGLSALAADTGGKTVFNSNSLGPGLSRALKETSTYYMLAWKPDGETQHASKFRRLEVKIVGQPDLTVQVRRGFFDVDPQPPVSKAAKEKKEKEGDPALKTPAAELQKVMGAAYPNHDIPIWLSLSYLNTPDKGPMLTAFLQVPGEFLSFVPANGKQTAAIDVAGTVLNEQGKSGAVFGNRLTVDMAASESARGHDVTYGYNIYLRPGLYQVRVGARDGANGRAGSAHGWIEIPDLSKGQLAMSSVITGGRAQSTISNVSATGQVMPAPAEMRIAPEYSASDYLRFMLFVYNAARSPTPADPKPDVALQVQVVRDGQPVITAPLKKLVVDGDDFRSIPFAAEVSLAGMPPGRYILQVTAVDRVSKQSASQQTRFEIH